MATSDQLARILADDAFQGFVTSQKEAITRKVMSAATSAEDREKALAEYHALTALVARMGSAAADKNEA